MDVCEAIVKRRSIRGFRPGKIQNGDLDLILNAARLAPSTSNLQPWRFIVVESDKMKAKLRECAIKFVADAAVTIICCLKMDVINDVAIRSKELYDSGTFSDTPLDKFNFNDYKTEHSPEVIRSGFYLNIATAIENMCLQATELGLGSCFVGMFEKDKVREMFCIPDDLEIVLLLLIGYPAENPGQRPRLNMDEIIINRV